MVAALTAAGKTDAVAALQTASAFWKKRVETIDEVLDPLLGKKSPRSGEQILASLERLARPDSGDASRLRRMMEAMPREEAASVRATVINRMGRPTKGAAEKSEEAGFSFDTFLTNWNNMTPRARRTMFPGASIEALDKLATVAAAAKRAGGAMNSSNTAGALTVQLLISAPQVWLLEPFTAIGLTAGQYAAGHLLASPRFARYLAGAPAKATPAKQRAWAGGLSRIATAEPALAEDIKAFQDAILRAINDNPGVAASAAQDEDSK